MLKRSFFNRSFVLLLVYTSLLALYVFKMVEKGFFDANIQELEALLGQTAISIKMFLIIISIVFSIIALYVAFFLSKFLVLIFMEEGVVSVADVFVAKSTTLVVNLVALLLLVPLSPHFQFAVNMLGVLMMYGLSLRRQGNIRTALLFCLPFVTDILIR